MRQITGVASSSPISIYTVDNVIPLSIIGDDTEVFKPLSATEVMENSDFTCAVENIFDSSVTTGMSHCLR